MMRKILLTVLLLTIRGVCEAKTYGAVSVATSATLILGKNIARAGVMIANNSGSTIYIGLDANVTTTTGIPIPPNSLLMEDHAYCYKDTIYAVVGSGTANARYAEWSFAEVNP